MPTNTRSMYASKQLALEVYTPPKRTRRPKPLRFVPSSRPVLDGGARVSKARFTIKSAAQASLETRRKDVQFEAAGVRRPRGLRNPHNFCYRRAVLTALLNLPAFVNWLSQCAQSHGGHGVDHNCLPCSLDSLAKAVHGDAPMGPALALADKIFRRAASSNPLWPWLGNIEQADAHEALSFVVDRLADKPAVQRMFQLKAGSEWACEDCTSIHTSSLQAETGLSLGIQTTASEQLDDHLAAHFSQTADEMVCELAACNSKAARRRTTSLFSAPGILVLHLARFSSHFDPRTGTVTTEKCNRRIRYGAELDLSPYADAAALAGGPLRYRLQAVVTHSGSLHGGHYVSVCRGPAGVFEFDDDRVAQVGEQALLTPSRTPYILLYVAI